MNLFVTVVVKTARCISALDKLIKTEFSFCVCFVLHGYIDCVMMKCKYILYIVRFFRVLVCFCCMLTMLYGVPAYWLVPPENCDLAQHNFCAPLTYLQIRAIFAARHAIFAQFLVLMFSSG